MKHLRSTTGSTLVEIMIALGLVGLVSLVIFNLSQDILKYINRNQLSSVRDQMATQFRQSAGRVANLRVTLKKDKNTQFHDCVCGTGAGCDTAQPPYTLFLYDTTSSPTNSASQDYIPLFYDTSGIPCDEDAENCYVRVKTSFIAQCMPSIPSSDPTPLAICPPGKPAEFIAVQYTVDQNPKTNSQGQLLKSISGSAFMQVSTLAPAGSGVCP